MRSMKQRLVIVFGAMLSLGACQATKSTPPLTGNETYEDGNRAADRGDLETTLRIWETLAQKGSERAQYGLGAMYYHGTGVQKNYEKAAYWYEKSAEQGMIGGQLVTGQNYYAGVGVVRNYVKAAEWIRKCAVSDAGICQRLLGRLYFEGSGVPNDRVQALMWLELAVEKKIQDSKNLRDKIAAFMSKADINKARRMAKDWVPDRPYYGPQLYGPEWD